jgi:hypothetical protein
MSSVGGKVGASMEVVRLMRILSEYPDFAAVIIARLTDTHGPTNALQASILAIAGFAADRSLHSTSAGMIIVCDRAAFGITDGKVDCPIGCARTSDHCFKSR